MCPICQKNSATVTIGIGPILSRICGSCADAGVSAFKIARLILGG